jgi:hypothetical protein
MDENEAREYLRKVCPPGTTVYTVLRSVARSGMSRRIDLYVIEDNRPIWITRPACTATGFGFNERDETMKLQGYGMDMGFHAVSTLSRVLYRDSERPDYVLNHRWI